ncbi:MAG: 2-amino-4-hydroxy-6-hydroxymethyldihydropteridine diphosphokinase [Alphaproteobacteria bacterium]|nr:2-amino-4-hydroxy-6-hydroxymethyldihydropteridine diphosphokinase [Alphaproteobacteria bacterium]
MIYIALGANVASPVGPPAVTLRRALEAMAKHGISVIAVSPLYRSQAWPNPADTPFVNAVAEVKTRLLPGQLLKALLAVEKAFGRVRKSRNEPRTLDLDLIDYGGLISDAEQLTLPHPRMLERAFVLRPLADIAPHWRHPDTGESIVRLLGNVGEAGLERLTEA